MKRLVVQRRSPPRTPQPGETVVSLDDVEDALDEAARDAVDEAAIAWTKQWGR